MRAIKKALLYIYLYLSKQTEEASHQITLFAIVMMINFPLFGVLWKFEIFQLTEEFILRMIATALCAMLATHQFWPSSWLRALPVLWYVALLFCLPFFFSYLTLLNHGSTLWLMNCVSAIFFLFLVTSVVGALALLVLGVSIAFIGFFGIAGHIAEYNPGNVSLFSLIITFTAAIIIGALFARDRELLYEGKISGMRLLAGSIAHDLRTPLASIHLQAELQEMLVEKLKNPEVRKHLKESLHKITRGIEMSNQLISMQLSNIQRDKLDTQNFKIMQIKSLLERSVEEYPFRKEQRKLIHMNLETDFSIWIGEVAFKNLIWNLLKNSLDFIEETGKGEITIWLVTGEEGEDFNYLHFKDTAKGIHHPEKIFDTFYSTRKGGTGVGLAYCKLLMSAAGGDILCDGSLPGQAHFILKFPKVD
ncbi:sensor histidine kinase [Legionella jamestowniensis]|uniref:histidine kinase n=1 Tax=Legionella jamestowniensis TaxID=455 RepID=A0A0W0UNH9_9GAMM|nr:HAMP domain-containing sensor histidine kinase [Legionella jamestowniensis]KTD09391.1 sensor histidine kinase/response regulator LuxN [Legionella jamestowniensis]OCH99217.1 histidine kinase [Legionella jamestowniensis]SFL88532.1 Signal transduction histidine kinase [Legionella jamestowniensis DSM 19215]